jgi:WhiB family redox-sensing transcriptional regulator
MMFTLTGQAWRLQAVCAETDPELWFPGKGGSSEEAKKVCRACPVRNECLDWALRTNEPYGVWGGLSTHERRKLMRRRVAA